MTVSRTLAAVVLALLTVAGGAFLVGAVAEAADRPTTVVDSPRPAVAAPVRTGSAGSSPRRSPRRSPGPSPGRSSPDDSRPGPSTPDPGAGPGAVGGTGFGWPVAPPPVAPRPTVPRPTVLRPFAPGPHRWSAGHRGVDLAATRDATASAAGPGVVTVAGPVAGRGVVVVDHGSGLRTTYQPVTPSVRRGDRVAAGQALGTLAADGHCGTAPCLHWGALRGQEYLDPLSLLLTRRPAVLLPGPGLPPGPGSP